MRRAVHAAMQGHRNRNAKLLAVLEEKGVALENERWIDFHFFCKDQQRAAYLARELYGLDYLVTSIGVADSESESFWSVEAGKSCSPREGSHAKP